MVSGAVPPGFAAALPLVVRTAVIPTAIIPTAIIPTAIIPTAIIPTAIIPVAGVTGAVVGAGGGPSPGCGLAGAGVDRAADGPAGLLSLLFRGSRRRLRLRLGRRGIRGPGRLR